MVRASKSTPLKLTIDWKASGGTYISSVSYSAQTVGTSWTLLTANGVAPDTTTQVTLTVPGSGWAIGDYVDLDSVMLVDGPATGNFADGNTANWIWNGSANNSTSTGPIQ
jgi:hypothetical protein